jgi:TonB family protein
VYAQQDDDPITQLPKLKRSAQATYPPKAQEEKVETEVILEIDIDAQGLVETARVAQPSPQVGYGFDEAALEAVLQFEFEPAATAKGPVPVTITWRYRFVLEVAKPPDDPNKPKEGPQGPAEGPQGPAEGPKEGPGPEGPKQEAPQPKEPVVNLAGVALERGTRLPLAGAPVVVFLGEGEGALAFEALTDAEGKFEFFDLQAGEWRVLVEPPGYYPFRTTEEVVAGTVTEVVYYVEKGEYNPFDVTVEGKRPRKEVNRRTLTVQEIERIPGNYGDPINVVKNLPGVARTQFGDGSIIVRGSAPEDTRVYLGSLEVPQLYHFGGLRSVVPAGVIKNLDFLPGNFSARYGRATGGVLDVGIKELRPEAVDGYVDVNLFDSGAYVEVPLGEDAAVAVAGRRSYIDTILTAVVPEDAPVNLIAAPRYYDFQLLGSWRPSLDHEIKGFFFGSDDKLELLFENPAEFNTQLTSGSLQAGTFFLRGQMEHNFIPNDVFRHDFQVSVGYDELGFSLGDQLYFNLYFSTFQFREEVSYKFSDEISAKVGADVLLTSGEIDLRAPRPPKEGDPPGDRDITETITAQEEALFILPALFLELELKPWEGMLLIPGVRLERYLYNDADSVVTDPRLSFRQKLDDQWVVKGGVGLYHQPPQPDEISDSFGNPELDYEEAVHWALGGEWTPLEYLTLDATVFYKDLTRLVGRSNRVVERDGELVSEVYNTQADGRVYGAEFLLRHEFANNFFGWVSYTVSRAERRDPDEDDYRLFDSDQTHILAILMSYRLPRNWELGLRWRYVSGNPETPVIGGVYNSDTDEYERILGAVNSARLPAFHQLDLRVDKSWIYDTWILSLYMDIQNTYNRSNVEGRQYNFDFSESRPQQGLPVLPALGIKVDF